MIRIELEVISKDVLRSYKGLRYTEYGVKFCVASAQGVTISRADKGAICPLCRALMKAGVKDQPWEAYRDNVLCLSGHSISWMARHDLVTTDAGFRYIKYNPFPSKMKVVS